MDDGMKHPALHLFPLWLKEKSDVAGVRSLAIF